MDISIAPKVTGSEIKGKVTVTSSAQAEVISSYMASKVWLLKETLVEVEKSKVTIEGRINITNPSH